MIISFFQHACIILTQSLNILSGSASNNPTTRQSMQTWFPFHIRERIDDITAKYPNGFIKSGVRRTVYRLTSDMERDIAELQLKKYKTCRRAVPKVMRAVGLKCRGTNNTTTFLGAAMQLLHEATVENRTAMKKVSRKMSNLRPFKIDSCICGP